jgi:hypothetical protein
MNEKDRSAFLQWHRSKAGEMFDFANRNSRVLL